MPDLVVVLHSKPENLDKLPYDLPQAGRLLHFNLGDLFPNLSYPVVASLDLTCLDALFDAQTKHLSACDAQAGWDLDEVSEILARPTLRVVGLVIDMVDRIMHGMELGSAGMHNQVRQWARQGFMRDLLGLLHTQGFRVYLASDHGNIEARGVGRPAEGAVADLRGERVRVYSDPRLRAQIKERFPESLEWPSVGLPEDYLAIIAPNRAAFVRAGETLVGHGGISVEELLVPLVQIDRRDR